MKLALFLFCGAVALAAQTFEVIQKKPLWPDGKGRIQISEDAIAFEAHDKENSRRWSYADIQNFDRVSTTEFRILTYEDQKWKLGQDRSFDFVLTSGELTDDLMHRIARRLHKPLTDRVVREPVSPRYELPVKHLHSLGGCEGRLVFTDSAISYASEHANDARVWQIDRDIQAVSSNDPYQLELRVYENNRREFGRSRVFKFALKEPLDPNFYRDLKLRAATSRYPH